MSLVSLTSLNKKKIINALYRVLKNYDPDNKYHRQKSFINFKQQCVIYFRLPSRPPT